LQKKKLILIDGNSLLYRSFYALPPLKTKNGTPTGGVYGFTRILMKLLREEKPDYIACAFDKGKKTFRHKRWKEYKSTRPETPHDLSQQGPLVKKVLDGFHIPFFEEEEYEADDILATLARKAEKAGLEVKIFTGDKDIFQILSPSISIVRFKKGISQTQVFDPEKVKKEYGILPEQIADYLSLVGDVSDNIPGVPGIGPKTATSLIQKFGSVEIILDNLEKLPSKLANKIKENMEQIKISKKLATVVTNIPLEFDLEKLKTRSIDKNNLVPIFKQLEFKELIKKFGGGDYEKKKNSQTLLLYKRASPTVETTCKLDEIDKAFGYNLIMHLEKEASGWQIALFSPSKEAIYQLDLGKNPYRHPLFKSLKEVFTSEKIRKIGHNLKDTTVTLKRWGVQLKGVEFDTSIAAYLLNPSYANYTLKNLCINFLEEEADDPSSPSSKVKLINKLYPILRRKLEESSLLHLFQKIEIPLVEVLAEMEHRGIKVDMETLKSFSYKIREKRKQIEKEIYQITGEKFNLNSSQQLAKILFETLNLPPLKKTKTGYSTSEEVIRALSAINPHLNKILEYRYLSKLESSYINPLSKLIDPSTGRVHTSFSQITASTGRLSSFKPNLQNIPIKEDLGKEIRKCFVANNGCLFISADYSQIELRILAHLSKDKKLTSAFLKGDDIHRETAAEIFNVLPLQVTPEMRRKAKAVNFGIIYGISPFGLARNLGISEGEAEKYIETYFNRYPGVKKYIEKTIKEAREKGFITTLMGRRRYIPTISSPNKRKRRLGERMAINSRIQGSAADLIKLAMVNLYRRLKRERLAAWIILQIHDELLVEVAHDEVEQVRKIVKKEMEEVAKLSVPIIANTKVGGNWAEMSN